MTMAKRRFGQNFLVDRGVVDRIIDAIRPQADETIIEIGPGRGALTARLLESAGRVVAIEFDRDLVPELRKQFLNPSLKLIEADALTVDFCEAIQPARARVVGNPVRFALIHALDVAISSGSSRLSSTCVMYCALLISCAATSASVIVCAAPLPVDTSAHEYPLRPLIAAASSDIVS